MYWTLSQRGYTPKELRKQLHTGSTNPLDALRIHSHDLRRYTVAWKAATAAQRRFRARKRGVKSRQRIGDRQDVEIFTSNFHREPGRPSYRRTEVLVTAIAPDDTAANIERVRTLLDHIAKTHRAPFARGPPRLHHSGNQKLYVVAAELEGWSITAAPSGNPTVVIGEEGGDITYHHDHFYSTYCTPP